ncbi:MAG: DUF4102 domain-containing protein [Rhizobiales bacterium]|nr:DUF4102 domain-containing protein [Hyphomicrobiales bacterium]
MARKTHKLTNVGVKNAKVGMHSDGGGLYLQVTDKHARSWLFRYAVNGRERYCGLGSLTTVSLADARQEAQRCRQMRLQGIDPIEARKAGRAAQALAASQGTTFKEAAEALIALKGKSFKASSQTEDTWRQTLEDYAYPVIGGLPVAAITTDHVLKVLEPLWHMKPATAGKLRGRIETVWNSYKARNPEAKLGSNPAQWRGHLDHLLSKRKRGGHHPALPYAEVGAFMAKLRTRPRITSDALEFVILTASRAGEVSGMRMQEVNFAKALWTVPKERMKMTRDHLVPLSDRALELIRKHAKDDLDALVFPSTEGTEMAGTTLSRVHRNLGDYRDRDGRPITTHGFRSTFRDWAGDCTAFPEEICEFAIAHVKGDEAEAAYRRSTALEKRRELMKAWAEYCDRIMPTDAKVIPIRQAV